MEEWQIEALKAIFETRVSEVEAGQRVYLSSETYGSRRYHLIEKRYDNGIQIEQIDSDEKWSKRVNFQSDEIPGFLKTLLMWYLSDERGQEENVSNVFFEDEPLGDLDDHPF